MRGQTLQQTSTQRASTYRKRKTTRPYCTSRGYQISCAGIPPRPPPTSDLTHLFVSPCSLVMRVTRRTSRAYRFVRPLHSQKHSVARSRARMPYSYLAVLPVGKLETVAASAQRYKRDWGAGLSAVWLQHLSSCGDKNHHGLDRQQAGNYDGNVLSQIDTAG